MKAAISKDPLLRYYNPNKLAIIECDAITKGLEPVVTQEGKPMIYASRTQTYTKRNIIL